MVRIEAAQLILETGFKSGSRAILWTRLAYTCDLEK